MIRSAKTDFSMRGSVHAVAGLGAAASLALYAPFTPEPVNYFAALALYVGSMAPDRLEFGIIPHRTLTHWPITWLGFTLAVWILTTNILATIIATSFSIGALVHISGDALTPMGIPVFQPFSRHSLAGQDRRTRNALLWSVFFWLPVLLLWGVRLWD